MNSKKLSQIRDKCYNEEGYLRELAAEIGLKPGDTMQLIDVLHRWIHNPQYRIEREGYSFWSEERHKVVNDMDSTRKNERS